MNFLIWIIIGIVALYIGIVLFYFFFQNRLIFVRYDLKGKYKFKLEEQHEEILLKSEEGETLHGLWMKVENAKGLIIYFHGNTGSLKRWGEIAAKLTKYGYDVLAPDYRGYGKSTGRPSEENLIKDAEIFYNYALKNYAEKSIVIYGRSLGSGVAVQLAAKHKAKLLILETPFASLLDVIETMFPFIPFKLLLKHPFKSIDFITQVQSTIVFMAGIRDSQVPYKSSLKLYDKVADRSNVYFYTFKKGDHNTLSSFKKFNRVLEEFL